MPFLNDPNVVYGFLLVALLFTVFAVLTPGTGLIELFATALWLATVLGLYQLSLRPWAIALLLLALLPLLPALRRPHQRGWLALSIALLLVGALFLIRPERGVLAIHPVWAITASTAFAALLWFGGQKIVEAQRRPHLLNVEQVVGQVGVTRTPVHHTGTVYVAGELWSARCSIPLPAGTRVRVIKREGLVLWVEPETKPYEEVAVPSKDEQNT